MEVNQSLVIARCYVLHLSGLPHTLSFSLRVPYLTPKVLFIFSAFSGMSTLDAPKMTKLNLEPSIKGTNYVMDGLKGKGGRVTKQLC